MFHGSRRVLLVALGAGHSGTDVTDCVFWLDRERNLD